MHGAASRGEILLDVTVSTRLTNHPRIVFAGHLRRVVSSHPSITSREYSHAVSIRILYSLERIVLLKKKRKKTIFWKEDEGKFFVDITQQRYK